VHETLRGLLRPAAAELIGSALFVFIACGSAMTTVGFQIKGNAAIGIALTFGFTIFVLAYTIGHISGGHLNFAVTFTFLLLRKISILKCLLYFLAQFFGGLIGIGFLKLITPMSWWNSCFAANVIQGELTVGHAFVAEFILTFLLMWVVMAACDSSKSNQTLVPLAIGMTVFVAHMIALPITGCSINPTRTFASAAAANGLSQCPNAFANHWVFWFAPILGASAAGFIYEYCFHDGGAIVDKLIDQYVIRKK
jgi:MIP family channel proteins